MIASVVCVACGLFRIIASGASRARLAIRCEDKKRSISIDDIGGQGLIESLGFGVTAARSSMEWKRITNMVFNMHPSESRHAKMSYRKCDCDSPVCWIGIIEIPKELPDGNGL